MRLMTTKSMCNLEEYLIFGRHCPGFHPQSYLRSNLSFTCLVLKIQEELSWIPQNNSPNIPSHLHLHQIYGLRTWWVHALNIPSQVCTMVGCPASFTAIPTSWVLLQCHQATAGSGHLHHQWVTNHCSPTSLVAYQVPQPRTYHIGATG